MTTCLRWRSKNGGYNSWKLIVTIEYNELNFSPLNDSIFEPPRNAERYNKPEIFYSFLIRLYAQAGQYEMAKYYTEKAYQNLQGDDNKRLYAYRAASLCFKLGQYAEALKYFKEIEKYPLGEKSKDTVTYYKWDNIMVFKEVQQSDYRT